MFYFREIKGRLFVIKVHLNLQPHLLCYSIASAVCSLFDLCATCYLFFFGESPSHFTFWFWFLLVAGIPFWGWCDRKRLHLLFFPLESWKMSAVCFALFDSSGSCPVFFPFEKYDYRSMHQLLRCTLRLFFSKNSFNDFNSSPYLFMMKRSGHLVSTEFGGPFETGTFFFD